LGKLQPLSFILKKKKFHGCKNFFIFYALLPWGKFRLCVGAGVGEGPSIRVFFGLPNWKTKWPRAAGARDCSGGKRALGKKLKKEKGNHALALIIVPSPLQNLGQYKLSAA